MKLTEHQHQFLLDIMKLWQFAREQGFTFTGGELYRTKEQQKIYYDAGKSKTMLSKHMNRLALDLNFFKAGQLLTKKESLQALGDYWESLSSLNRWGGNWSFVDTPHFERNV